MIELYDNDPAVCAQKVRFAMAEKKLSKICREFSIPLDL